MSHLLSTKASSPILPREYYFVYIIWFCNTRGRPFSS